jgi:sporulation protein YlmC with PRC-barrel domain
MWTLGLAVADEPQQATDTQSRHLSRSELIFQSSHLGKLDVFNRDNEKLGSLENLIVCAHTGQVHYGILDTGLTGKKVVVPWNAFRVVKEEGDRTAKHHMVLNMSKDRLANAPTYDRDNIGNLISENFIKSVNEFFGVRTVARPTGTDTGEKGNGQHLSRAEMIFESSHLAKLDVFNQDNVDLGDLEDLIIDAHTGQVMHAILDTGVGGKKVIVPWNGLRLAKDVDNNKYYAMLNISKDRLASAPAFEERNWPDFASEDFQRRVGQFFGVRVAARPTQPDTGEESPRPQR